MGPIRQKMGRILLYVIQRYSTSRATDPRDSDYDDYAGAYKLIYRAWKELNADEEFCEQLELNLPAIPFSIYDDTHTLPTHPNGVWLGAPHTVTS